MSRKRLYRDVGGSIPSPRTNFSFRWREKLPCANGVYNIRTYVKTPWFSLRLHHWLHSDDARHFHDHPWWFYTLVLKGGYTDVSPAGEERMRAGRIRFRPAHHQHTVRVDPGGCWTFLITGPEIRRWGFWVGPKWLNAKRYFFKKGVHACDS